MVPAVTPVTVPVPLIVATEVFVLLHTAPVVTSLSTVVAPPSHTVLTPAIASGEDGEGLTVKGVLIEQPEPVIV